LKKVKICGVPEHFNLPWHFAVEEGAFESRGISLEWQDVPEGTGRMSQMLASGETDLAIILTEGIIKSISDGNPSSIVQTYIASPLLWGVHVAGESKVNSLDDLKETKAAISRFGSGSHLMAFVMAQNLGWDTETLSFEVIHNLQGAVEALTEGNADYFMWEHFTTKPLVDAGTFKFIEDCPTPWPCFVIAGNNAFLESNPTLLPHILEVINGYTQEFKRIPSIDRTFANRYPQKLADIQEWLGVTEWSQQPLSKSELVKVSATLKTLGLLGEQQDLEKYFWEPA